MTATKSPFPGMDPYLEPFWREVHSGFMIYARDQLQAALPQELRARIEERVFIESELGAEQSVYPDLAVIEQPQYATRGTLAIESGVAVAEPVIVHVTADEVTETFIEIVDARSGNRVVTVIELLSLANKRPGAGQDLYLEKQQELRWSDVSVVEIDLLRAGQRVLMVRDELLKPALRTTYRICVRRGWARRRFENYPIRLRDRLPRIGIPLRQTDRDVPLDLQAVLDQCYLNGRYRGDIDYAKPLDPPLDAEDGAWVDALLREQGVR